MSDRNDQHNILKNDETIRRRIWIDRAVQGARRRLEAGEPIPELAESAAPPAPHLSVVPGGRER